MIPELKGKGLFVFSDPGGAKPVLALIKLNPELKDYLVVSDREYDFFSDFNISVTSYTTGCEADILKRFSPDFIFTGTSYTSSIELNFILIAKKFNIPSYAFVDHYTNFLNRFELNGMLVYPDTICVIDSIAHSLVIGFQTPADVIVTSNFYHDYLKGWKPSVSKDFFFTKSSIPKKNKLIVFAPEPLSNVGGKDFYGLDEFTVFSNFIKVLNYFCTDNISIVIKAHPNQKKELFENINFPKSLHIISGHNLHVNTLIYHADVVIGIFSNILIEAAILETKVIRCLIGLKKEDPFSHFQIGKVANSESELASLIQTIIS
jgi:predicted glycosyltransferase